MLPFLWRISAFSPFPFPLPLDLPGCLLSRPKYLPDLVESQKKQTNKTTIKTQLVWSYSIEPPALGRENFKVRPGYSGLYSGWFQNSPGMEIPQPTRAICSNAQLFSSICSLVIWIWLWFRNTPSIMWLTPSVLVAFALARDEDILLFQGSSSLVYLVQIICKQAFLKCCSLDRVLESIN